MAHLAGTPGFTLRALRFLVVDETDRLLRQAYQGWLPSVLGALEGSGGGGWEEGQGQWAQAGGAGAGAAWVLQEQQQAQRRRGEARVVKFVVSATLTRDPSKIDRLQLHCPRYVATSAGEWGGRAVG